MRTESSIQFLPRCFFSMSNELTKYSKIQLESRGSRKYNGFTLLYKEVEKNIVTDIAVFQFHSHSTTYEFFFFIHIPCSHSHAYELLTRESKKMKMDFYDLKYYFLFLSA